MRPALLLAALSTAAAQDVTWCGKAPQSSWPLCNATLDITVRAADAVARLSLTDKFAALMTATNVTAGDATRIVASAGFAQGDS